MLHNLPTQRFHHATRAPQETRPTPDVLGLAAHSPPRTGGRSSSLPVLLLFQILFLLSVLAPPALAQPSPDSTLSAFTTLQRHIRDWSPLTDAESFPSVLGACLTLKLRGEVIARATIWSDHPFDDKPESATVLPRALAQALKLAEPKLGVPNDALRDDAIKQVAQDITLSLELAGSLIAIEPATWDDAEMLLRPGLDGVAVRNRGSGASPSTATSDLQSIFPSQTLLNNTLPHRALGSAIAQSIGEGGAAAALEDPKKIRAQHTLRLYRFRTTHAAQSSSVAPASLLFRGERLIPAASPSAIASLRTWADSLASNLISRPGDGLTLDSMSLRCWSLRDYADYKLVDDAPKFASASAADLAAIRSRVTGAQANELSRTAVSFATIVDPEPASPSSLLLIRAGAVNPAAPSGTLVSERALSVFAGTRSAQRIMKIAGCGNAISGEANGVVESIKDAFAKTPEPQLVAAMPWLGWAAVENPVKPDAADHDWFPIAERGTGEILGTLSLRRMRDQVWQHQLTPLTATEDTQDMIGGIVFTSGLADGSSGGGNPYPTWQCVRPLAFIATMLGDPRLTTPEERPREIANLLLAMRYLRQLQVDDASAWMYPNPEQAKGGIRAAVWDTSEPTDATSLTLLCVTELLKSLDKLSAEKPTVPQSAPTPPPAK